MPIDTQAAMVLEALALFRRLKRAAHRVAAKVEFTLQGRKRLAPLSEEQHRQFRTDGYLLVSRLIPEDLVSRAQATMWQSLGAKVDSPSTWARLGPHPNVIRDERLTALYTDLLLAAAAQLAEEDVAGFRRPTHAFTVNNVPVSRSWQAHWPHVDNALPSLRVRTFPRPYGIGVLIYLTEVRRHGGGTFVFPGSHTKLEALARANPRKYKHLSALNDDLSSVDLGPSVEVTASRGDALFYHYLCAHSSSDNVSPTPRLAISHKW